MTRTTRNADPTGKYTYDTVTAHCTSYFDRPCNEWNHSDFVTHSLSLVSLEFDVVNHRWLKSLATIEASMTEDKARRSRARSLIDRAKRYSVRQPLPSIFFMVPCDVGIG